MSKELFDKDPKDHEEDILKEEDSRNPPKNQFKSLEKDVGSPKDKNDQRDAPTNGKDEEEKTADPRSGAVQQSSSFFTWGFQVQILDSMHTNASRDFAKYLDKNLGWLYKCRIKTDPDELEDTKPLIVVCIHNTRLIPDIDSALRNVKYPSQLMVVIVHTGSKNNLPETESSKILFDYKRKSVTFIDMGFDVDNGGIYKCRQNKEAIDHVKRYVKNHSTASTEGSPV